MIIALEIDNIISTPVSQPFKLMDVSKCEVLPGVKEALDKLKDLNHVIWIYSKRDVSLGMETEIWLKKNKIPYDKIILSKPQYDILIDEKVYKFDTWDKFFEKYVHVLNSR